MKVSRTAAMGTLYMRIHFLLLLIVAAVNAQSKSDVAIQDTYQKLEKRHISQLKTFLLIHFAFMYVLR